MGVVDWTGLAQDRCKQRALVNAVMNLRVLQKAGKLPSGCTSCVLSCGTRFQEMMFAPHRKHAYGFPQPVIEIALLLIFYLCTTVSIT
jgi:hypothetical protein